MRVAIAGAGRYGEVFQAYLSGDARYEVVCFMDDDERKIYSKIGGAPVVGGLSDWEEVRKLGVEGIIAPIGDNEVRCGVLAAAHKEGFGTPNVVHSSVILDSRVCEGYGVYILPGSIVMPFVDIDRYSMVSMGCKLAHHTRLGAGAFVSTGANIGASVDIGAKAFVGIGSTIMTGVKRIGTRATIGAGAVVIKDVADGATVAGVPARPLR